MSQDEKSERNQNSIDTYTNNRGDTYFHESLVNDRAGPSTPFPLTLSLAFG